MQHFGNLNIGKAAAFEAFYFHALVGFLNVLKKQPGEDF